MKQGLILTLGGAPNTPHCIPGVPGLFRPDVATPVGEGCNISLEDAKALDAGPEDLALVEIEDVYAAEKAAADAKKASKRALRDARHSAEGAEIALVNDEREAITT